MSAAAAAAHLLLRTDAGALQLPVGLLARVEPLDELVAVPRAPEGVAGLAEVGGRVVTLLDPAGWSGPVDAPGAGLAGGRGLPRSALLLAPPFGHLALLVPAGAALGPADGQEVPALTADALQRYLRRARETR
jgi:hypothetical protein